MADTNGFRALGSIAFARGIPMIPILDGSVRDRLVGREVGDRRTEPELRAWIAGWTEANLRNNQTTGESA